MQAHDGTPLLENESQTQTEFPPQRRLHSVLLIGSGTVLLRCDPVRYITAHTKDNDEYETTTFCFRSTDQNGTSYFHHEVIFEAVYSVCGLTDWLICCV